VIDGDYTFFFFFLISLEKGKRIYLKNVFRPGFQKRKIQKRK
jgi:hypothetical protein